MSGVNLRIAQIYHADENFGKYMETKYSYLIYIFEFRVHLRKILSTYTMHLYKIDFEYVSQYQSK